MINRIMTTRAAVLALAAPLLITLPALAQHGHSQGKRSGAVITVQSGNVGFSINTSGRGYTTYGHNTNRGHRNLNQFGQTPREVQQLKRNAAQQCRRAINFEARQIGFRDVDYDDGRRVRQIGPQGFRVTFNEVEFETRRRDIERIVTCTVRRGQVRSLEGVPQRANRGHRQNTGHRY
jgi:hypothetical protein